MRIKEVRKAYSYTRALPVNYSEAEQVRFESIRECIVSEAFLEELREVSVSQYYIFSGTKLLEDFCLPIQKRGQVHVWKQWLKSRVFPQTQIPEAIWITDSWARNYFHWILECLPRLFALQAQGIKAPLLIPEHIYGAHYVKESLADLQVQVITFNFRQTIKVNSLYVASHDSPCAFDPLYLKNVIFKFQELDSPQTKDANRRIYISRKDAGKRKVENETELIPMLQEHAFEIIQMEKLSFREQRELMRETKVLMSIHGAGLANLIFMSEESKVIELHPDVERYNSCFYHLAAALNREYYYRFERADHSNPQEASITIDLEKLENLLKTI
jgi:capsular polysaccharide biosynthesis protein